MLDLKICARKHAHTHSHTLLQSCVAPHWALLYCFTVSSKQVFPVLAPPALTPIAHVSYVMLFAVARISGMQLCDTRLFFVVILQQLAMSTLTGVFVLPLVFPVTCSCCDCSGSATQSSLHCGRGVSVLFPVFPSLLISSHLTPSFNTHTGTSVWLQAPFSSAERQRAQNESSR